MSPSYKALPTKGCHLIWPEFRCLPLTKPSPPKAAILSDQNSDVSLLQGPPHQRLPSYLTRIQMSPSYKALPTKGCHLIWPEFRCLPLTRPSPPKAAILSDQNSHVSLLQGPPHQRLPSYLTRIQMSPTYMALPTLPSYLTRIQMSPSYKALPTLPSYLTRIQMFPSYKALPTLPSYLTRIQMNWISQILIVPSRNATPPPLF